MHESHQVQHLIAKAKDMLLAKGIAQAKQVSILVGDGLGFDEMSIRLHWEEFSTGTPLENAELFIQTSPAKLQCPSCSALFIKKGSNLSCPACHVQGIPTEHGKEFLIQDMS